MSMGISARKRQKVRLAPIDRLFYVLVFFLLRTDQHKIENNEDQNHGQQCRDNRNDRIDLCHFFCSSSCSSCSGSCGSSSFFSNCTGDTDKLIKQFHHNRTPFRISGLIITGKKGVYKYRKHFLLFCSGEMDFALMKNELVQVSPDI